MLCTYILVVMNLVSKTEGNEWWSLIANENDN